MKLITVILCIISISGVLFGKEDQNHYEIKKIENGYSYAYDFKSTLSIDSVLAILYKFDHLVKYSSQIPQMEVLSEEKNSYVVSFIFKYLFYSSESVYRRTLLAEKGMVVIQMLHFNHNSTVLPRVLKIEIEYRVVPEIDGVRIFHQQKCLFNKQVNWFYLKILEGKLNDSMKELQQYISSKS